MNENKKLILRKNVGKISIWILPIISLVVAIYFCFTYGRANIHSDACISYRYWNAALSSGQLFPDSWQFVFGEVYAFRIMIISALTTFFCSDKTIGTALAPSILLVLTALAIIWQSKKVFRNNHWFIAVPLFAICLGSPETRSMLYVEGTYLTEMLGITLVVGLIYLVYKRESEHLLFRTISLCILLFVMGLSGSRYFAETIVPVVIAMVLGFYKKIKYKNTTVTKTGIKTQLGSFLIVLLPVFAGFAYYKHICATHFMHTYWNQNTYFDLAMENLPDTIESVLARFVNIFGYTNEIQLLTLQGFNNMVSIVFCIIVCLLVPVLQLTKLHRESEEVQFFVDFAIIHNLIMLIMAIFFGKTWERYLLSSVYVCIILSARYIYAYWLNKDNMDRYIWVSLFSIAIVIKSFNAVADADNWKDLYNTHVKVCDALLDKGLSKGYATFWNGYTYEIYSNGKLRFGGIGAGSDSVSAIMWNNDASFYQVEDTNSFIMLSEDQLDLYEPQIEIFGAPIDEFVIEDAYAYQYASFTYAPTNYYVYVYDYDIASLLPNGFYDGVLTTSDLTFNYYGGRDLENGVTHLEQGGIVQGPWSNLDSGSYYVSFEGDDLEGAEFDVLADSCQDREGVIEYTELERHDNMVIFQLDLNQSVEDIRFRVMNNNPEIVDLYDIRLERK